MLWPDDRNETSDEFALCSVMRSCSNNSTSFPSIVLIGINLMNSGLPGRNAPKPGSNERRFHRLLLDDVLLLCISIDTSEKLVS